MTRPTGWQLLCASLVVALATLASSARAGDLALHLTWNAPEGCPTSSEVESEVARLLGAHAETTGSRRLVAVSTIEHSERGGWTVRLDTTLDGASGQRVLTGDSCKAVARATALILAFAIDPDAAGRALRNESVSPPPPPPPAPEVPAPPKVVPQAPSASPSMAADRGYPAGNRRCARSEAGARCATRVRSAPRSSGFGVFGVVSQVRPAAAIERAGAGGISRLWAAGAHVCGVAEGSMTARLCGGGELEYLTATGFGVAEPGHNAATMPAGVISAELAVPLTKGLSFALQVGGAARAYHPRFVLDRVGTVFDVPILSAFGGAGLELVF